MLQSVESPLATGKCFVVGFMDLSQSKIRQLESRPLKYLQNDREIGVESRMIERFGHLPAYGTGDSDDGYVQSMGLERIGAVGLYKAHAQSPRPSTESDSHSFHRRCARSIERKRSEKSVHANGRDDRRDRRAFHSIFGVCAPSSQTRLDLRWRRHPSNASRYGQQTQK